MYTIVLDLVQNKTVSSRLPVVTTRPSLSALTTAADGKVIL